MTDERLGPVELALGVRGAADLQQELGEAIPTMYE
jgi:hypothetical protein